MGTEHHGIWSGLILPIFLNWKTLLALWLLSVPAQHKAAASPRPLEVTVGNAGNHRLKPKGSQQFEGEGNKFTTTAPPVMILNKAATNRQCLDSQASVSSKGGMQLSCWSWWKIRGSVPSQNWDTKSHWKARIKCTHFQQSGFTTWCLYTEQWWCKENNP